MGKSRSKRFGGDLYVQCPKCGNFVIIFKEGTTMCHTCWVKQMKEDEMIEYFAERSKKLGGG